MTTPEQRDPAERRAADARAADARAADARAADARVADSRDDDTVDTVDTGDHRHAAAPVPSGAAIREDVVAREEARFGGVKVGSAFFGWLAAMGIAVLLAALVAATGVAVALGTNNGNSDKAGQAASDNAASVGIGGCIALIVIALIAYYCGGYVAGRMARFNGIRQGFTVWLWAVAVAIIVAIIGAIGGAQYNILGSVNAFPRIPIDEGTLTTLGVITAVLVAIASLVGAIVGGLAGMRYHRRVDRAGFGG
ncbi:hypothetical protein OSC27_09215 [Microbacterium sp. STN6]|uniref:hypothetical protein n=1 Tax=Microbacterium sp. STN6 TaxID=2995588 RepID=UPI0022609902|nr:hypothetical protein [Microbacterium sp. STN6]MCX7522456.1 hypothetical protein [Microbacterium sp. STN6]